MFSQHTSFRFFFSCKANDILSSMTVYVKRCLIGNICSVNYEENIKVNYKVS